MINFLIQEIQRVVEVVAGLSGSKLLMIKAQSLAEEIADFISDLREISSMREERLIIYIEAPELLIPNERMIDLLRIPNESKAELLRAKAKIANVLREIVNRANFIAATASERWMLRLLGELSRSRLGLH